MNRRRPTCFVSPAIRTVAWLLCAVTATVHGQFIWLGGDLNPVGLPLNTVGAQSTLSIETTADHDYNAKALVNHGTITWSGGRLRGGNGSSITNNAHWNDTASNLFNNDYQGTPSVFINTSTGVYNKSGAGTSTFAIPLHNAGRLNVTGGVLSINGGGTFADGSQQTGNAILQLAAGTLTATGSMTFSNFHLVGGMMAGVHTLNGNVMWQSGTFNNAATTTIGAAGVLTIATTNDHDFNSHHFVNDGLVAWSAGRIRSGNSGSFTNNAVFRDTASNILNNDYLGVGWSFRNAATGTYEKAGPGTSTFQVAFHNDGVIDVSSGTLALAAGGTLSDGSAQTGTGALQLNAGTLTATGRVSFSNLIIAGGMLAGFHTLEGSVHWHDGHFNNTDTTTIGAGGTLTIGTTNDHDFNSHRLVNDGTVNWNGGRIRSGNSGAFVNNATFNDTASNTWNNDYLGTPWIFTNAASGTYNKLSTGVTTFLNPFHNIGTVHVAQGIVSIAGGGVLHSGSTQTGAGALQLTSGTLTVNGDATSSNFVIAGGMVTGAPILHGNVHWQSGTFNNSDTTHIASDGILNVVSTNDHDFNSHHFVNDGQVNWSGGRIRAGNGGSFLNRAVFNDHASNAFNNDYLGTPWIFHNAATGFYNKNAAGTTSFLSPLHNYGTLNTTAGVLSLNVGGSFFDGSVQTGNATLQLSAGTLTINGSSTFSNFVIAGGQIDGVHTLQGAITWQSGTFNNTATTTVGAAGTLVIAGGLDHDFNSHHVINEGVVQWAGGRLRSGNGGSIVNHGQWIDTASNVANNDYLGTTWGFTNAIDGAYSKSAAGTTTFSVPFANAGTLDISRGIFKPASLSLASTAFLQFGIGGVTPGTQFGQLSYASALALAGTLEIYFLNDAHLALTGSESFTLISGGTLSGSFANVTNGQRVLTADGFGSFQVNYGAGSPFGANALVISGFTAVPEPSTCVLLGIGVFVLAFSAVRRAKTKGGNANAHSSTFPLSSQVTRCREPDEALK